MKFLFFVFLLGFFSVLQAQEIDSYVNKSYKYLLAELGQPDKTTYTGGLGYQYNIGEHTLTFIISGDNITKVIKKYSTYSSSSSLDIYAEQRGLYENLGYYKESIKDGITKLVKGKRTIEITRTFEEIDAYYCIVTAY